MSSISRSSSVPPPLIGGGDSARFSFWLRTKIVTDRRGTSALDSALPWDAYDQVRQVRLAGQLLNRRFWAFRQFENSCRVPKERPNADFPLGERVTGTISLKASEHKKEPEQNPELRTLSDPSRLSLAAIAKVALGHLPLSRGEEQSTGEEQKGVSGQV